MSEEDDNGGTVEMEFVYAESNIGKIRNIMHGGPTGRVTLEFSIDVAENISLIIGNIPYFDGDPDQQISAAVELIDLIKTLVTSDEVKDAILENMEDDSDELDDEEREDEEE